MRHVKGSAFLLLVFASLFVVHPAHSQCDLPEPIEIDQFPTSSAVLEIIGPNGTERVPMIGPSVVHVAIGINGEAADTDGDGLDQVKTVMLQLSLTGSGSMGPINVEIRPATKDPFKCSVGEIEENANTQSGRLDVPPFAPSGTATSVFNIFFEITVSTPAGPVLLHNREPKVMRTVIDHKPPAEGEFYENPQTIQLFFEDDTLAPYFIGPARHVPDPEPFPPICSVRAVTGGVDVTVSDAGGLGIIMVNRQENTNVNIPGFPLGSPGPVVVTGRKDDPNKRSMLELKVIDLSGNTIVCDPVLTLRVRETGKPVTEILSNIPQAEGKVTVLNGTPGVSNLKVEVNGTKFMLTGLAEGEQRTLDVSSAMKPGNGNVIVLAALGKPGGSVEVIIHD